MRSPIVWRDSGYETCTQCSQSLCTARIGSDGVVRCLPHPLRVAADPTCRDDRLGKDPDDAIDSDDLREIDDYPLRRREALDSYWTLHFVAQ